MISENLTLGGIECSLAQCGKGGKAMLSCSGEGLNMAGGLADLVLQNANRNAGNAQENPFCILEFNVKDWDDELSPWECGAFKGHAQKTLDWMEGSAIPFLARRGYASFGFAGYSLAGLFGLWCARGTDIFSAVASCSGSLWYPNWSAFASGNPIRRKGCVIYLSLGGKEAMSKDPLISTIQTMTKEESDRLKKDVNVSKTVLEMNPGGHFTKIPQRIAKGISYIIVND